jgi:bifunctional DNA-binding transcriptional regulator/antitoxin component of YhaV-PrlF toxin-antitoxin module
MPVIMANIRLHDHGWLSLPADLRHHLDLRTGDRLHLDMIEGGLRLRLASQATTAEVTRPAPLQAVPDEPVAKRGRGRPRKQGPAEPPLVEPQAELPLQAEEVRPEEATAMAGPAGKRASRSLLPKLKVGGRRKSLPADTI